jgi:hypothetical protein
MKKYIKLNTSPLLLPNVIDKNFQYSLFFHIECSLEFSDEFGLDNITEEFFIKNADDILCYRVSSNPNISSSIKKIKNSGFYYSSFQFFFDKENERICFILDGHMNLDVDIDRIFKSLFNSFKYVGNKPLKEYSYRYEIVQYSDDKKSMCFDIQKITIRGGVNSIKDIMLNLFGLKDF